MYVYVTLHCGASSDAKAVTSRLEQEMGLVQSVVQEGEEAVARLRSQLADLQEREETSQQQLAHAIAQVKPYCCRRETCHPLDPV